MSINRGASLRDWLILSFLALVWGSSFILIKKALIGFSATEVAALRIGISTIAFVPIFLLFFRNGISRRDFKWVALVGLLGNGIPALAFAIAQTRVVSSVAGILNSLTPIFTWLFGLLFFAVIVTRNQFIGVVAGFIGALIIIALDPDFTITFDAYSVLIVLATICYALSGNIVKTHLQDVHPTVLSAFAFFTIGPVALIYLATTDVVSSVASDAQARISLLAAAILALVGTVTATVMFYKLVQRTTAVFATSVAYLIPLTALAWGIIDGETVQWTHVAGMAFIIGGVYVMRNG